MIAVAACSAPGVVRPISYDDGLAALPKAAAVDTDRYSSISVCVRCHTAGEHAMRDSQLADMSPVADLATSMMGLAARDPYYLAALRRELHVHDERRDEILGVCVKCHAPVGFAEARARGQLLGLGQLEASTEPAAVLGREGVACAGCHALEAAPAVTLRADRVAYGTQPQPLDETMREMIKTRVETSPRMLDSALCGTCHTVELGDFLEQATYLEWQASAYAPDQTCQSCHLGDAGPSVFSTRPPDAPVREHFRRHAIRGGNAFLLERLSHHTDWLGAPVTAAALTAAATDTEQTLARAATLEIAGSAAELRVTVTNRTGHKLPTGYPTRRMWLHVRAVDAGGRVVFESGPADHADPVLAIVPHRNRITAPDEVQIWEAVPVDAHGARTHVQLDAVRFAKDDRILPEGLHDAPRLAAIGVDGDADFVPGHDTVTYVLPAQAARVEVELLYQPIPPETLASYAPSDGPEAKRFLAIATAPEPQVLARASWERKPAT